MDDGTNRGAEQDEQQRCDRHRGFWKRIEELLLGVPAGIGVRLGG